MGKRSSTLVCALLLTVVFVPTARADVVHLPRGVIDLPPSLAGRTVSGLAVDGAGSLYVGVRGAEGNSVAVFSPAGAYIRAFSIGGIATAVGEDGGCDCDDLDLAVGPDSLLYVGQPTTSLGVAQDRYISVYTTSGTLVRELNPTGSTLWVGDLELDAAGSIYALVRHAGQGFHRGAPDEVLRMNPTGTITARFPLTAEESSGFDSEVGGLALAPDGSIWVTTPLDGSRLIHLAADGSRLPAPPLDAIVPLKTRNVKEVDLANGMLYIAAGRPNGLVVITPEGRRVDRLGGEARQLAIAGQTVFATRLGTGSAQTAQTERQDRLAKFLAAEARPPDEQSAVDQRGGCGRATINPVDTFVHVNYPSGATSCDLRYVNYSKPRCDNGPAERPANVYVGGRPAGPGVLGQPVAGETAVFTLDRDQVGDGGNVVVEWACSTSPVSYVYEVKGAIDLIDPSGNVLDAKTGRPVQFATVRLQFTPVSGGRFGTPSLSLMRPQVNPQTSAHDGAFGWDVAAGFWRLRVSAFGYNRFTSPTFEIPPEVTGLRLLLRRSSAYRRLINPAGSVGDVRVGGKLRRRVRGLRVQVRRSRVRDIAVRGRGFRTAAGIRLRSSERDLLRAYPAAKRPRRARRGVRVVRFKRAFFTVRRGRVVAIRLARR